MIQLAVDTIPTRSPRPGGAPVPTDAVFVLPEVEIVAPAVIGLDAVAGPPGDLPGSFVAGTDLPETAAPGIDLPEDAALLALFLSPQIQPGQARPIDAKPPLSQLETVAPRAEDRTVPGLPIVGDGAVASRVEHPPVAVPVASPLMTDAVDTAVPIGTGGEPRVLRASALATSALVPVDVTPGRGAVNVPFTPSIAVALPSIAGPEPSRSPAVTAPPTAPGTPVRVAGEVSLLPRRPDPVATLPPAPLLGSVAASAVSPADVRQPAAVPAAAEPTLAPVRRSPAQVSGPVAVSALPVPEAVSAPRSSPPLPDAASRDLSARPASQATIGQAAASRPQTVSAMAEPLMVTDIEPAEPRSDGLQSIAAPAFTPDAGAVPASVHVTVPELVAPRTAMATPVRDVVRDAFAPAARTGRVAAMIAPDEVGLPATPVTLSPAMSRPAVMPAASGNAPAPRTETVTTLVAPPNVPVLAPGTIEWIDAAARVDFHTVTASPGRLPSSSAASIHVAAGSLPVDVSVQRIGTSGPAPEVAIGMPVTPIGTSLGSSVAPPAAPIAPGPAPFVAAMPAQAQPPCAVPRHWQVASGVVVSSPEVPVAATASALVEPAARSLAPAAPVAPPNFPFQPGATVRSGGIAMAATQPVEAGADRPGLPTIGTVAPVMAASLAAFAPVAEAPVLDMRQERWPQGMIAQIERLQDAADAVDTRIRLLPDALGGVSVDVRREGDTLHVRFQAEQAQTRALIQEAQPRLAEAAEARGLRLGQSSVDVGGQQGAGQQGSASANQQPGQQPGQQQRQPATTHFTAPRRASQPAEPNTPAGDTRIA